MLMYLKITTENVPELADPIKIVDYDTCKTTEYSTSMVSAFPLKNDIFLYPHSNGLLCAVPVTIDLNTTNISSSNNSSTYPGFFHAGDDYVATQFYLKPALGVQRGVPE